MYLTVSNEYCSAVDSVLIIVDASSELLIPNVFTPNDDNFNNTWHIKSAGIKEMEVKIFDRFGPLLSEISSGASVGWDGTFNGQPMPSDDYWFTLTLEDGRTTSGHFSLKR